MGYTTDLIGHIEIQPPLNHAEQLYLTAFSQSRRGCGRAVRTRFPAIRLLRPPSE